MSVDPNEIWKKFDFFVRGRLKHVPEHFKYMDLNKCEPEQWLEIIRMTLEMLVKNETNVWLRDLLGDWNEFMREGK